MPGTDFQASLGLICGQRLDSHRSCHLFAWLAEKIAYSTGLGNIFVGNIFVAVATSLPELTICIAAVKIDAVDMAVGNIFGSNLFNLMILALEDIFYFAGPLLAAAEKSQAVAIAMAMAMTGLAISGLIYNSKKKKFITAWDSTGVIALYCVNLILLYLMRQPAGAARLTLSAS